MASATNLELFPEQIEFGMIMEGTELDEGDDPEYIPRQRNLGKIQHRKFTGYDQRLPMVIYGFLEQVVHGTSAAGVPNSLIIFRWGIQQRSAGKRLQSAKLSAVFQTTRRKNQASGGGIDAYYDPHVVAMAPHGTCSMLATPVAVGNSHSIEGGFEAGMGFAKGTGKVTYELSQSAEGTDQVVINGFERNIYDNAMAEEVGDPDRCNAVEWQLFENKAVRSGLPSFFRTAVRLERREEDYSDFHCTFTIRGKIDNVADGILHVKRFFGLIPRDDPIIFQPTLDKSDLKVDDMEPLVIKRDKLDGVVLSDLCKFVMFKSSVVSGMSTKDKKPTVD
ncbi:hypothetical protein O1611_g6284 [Lasiodiplodia mahajangana]|uniref:Uncharacterized protein n=1 Tax=Lasiodiplodia mahajangana TaxID=1108764 RepID=A0ACC2JIV3_9PEZI|nr:hypothetical protein O1611_g6284 [Lasiodiplodia mahajangana]